MVAPTILTGDCQAVLATLPADSFQACVTSPPYFGLRDYGVDGQIGLEESPEAYVAKMVEVFRAVRRVLRPDGTLWLNLGDSYAGSWGAQGRQGEGGQMADRSVIQARSIAAHPRKQSRTGSTLHLQGIKAKDAMLMPERTLIALQADGWWVRDKIIWRKPNPMPSSVRDRFCPAWEPVFLLSRSARYFFDIEAAREPLEPSSMERLARGGDGSARANGGTRASRPMKAVYSSGNKERRHAEDVGDPRDQHRGRSVPWEDSDGKRLMRNVWDIATEPFKGAHFATFPTALAERCIKAGSSEKGQCPHCGAPWARQVDVESRPNWQGGEGQKHDGKHYRPNPGGGVGNDARPRIDRGWSPSCDCPPHTPTPQHVLDPFGGAGTVGLVASRLQREATLIELNPAYAEMARERCRADAPLLMAEGT